jgi:serine/threonine protein kinase
MIQVGNATQIWEAMNSSDHVRVAIKIPRERHAKEKGQWAELRHEFDVGRSLNHPCVIRLIELGFMQRVPYLVMEYFPAPNLRQCLRQYPERITQFLPRVITQAAQAIGHMHDRGWVHRDIKPENLLLHDDGQLKLIDFAIASRIPKGLGKLWKSRAAVQGTRSYISPEQIRGEVVDQRADVYSFGCTVFHILAGKPPYTGTTADELLMRHLRGSIPSVAGENTKVTPEFNRLIQATMARRAADRPQSMAEFLERLSSLKILQTDRRTVRDAIAEDELNVNRSGG